MKTKLLLLAIAIVAGLYLLNQSLNEGPRSRGSLETADGRGEGRPSFTVGFLPVT